MLSFIVDMVSKQLGILNAVGIAIVEIRITSYDKPKYISDLGLLMPIILLHQWVINTLSMGPPISGRGKC